MSCCFFSRVSLAANVESKMIPAWFSGGIPGVVKLKDAQTYHRCELSKERAPPDSPVLFRSMQLGGAEAARSQFSRKGC